MKLVLRDDLVKQCFKGRRNGKLKWAFSDDFILLSPDSKVIYISDNYDQLFKFLRDLNYTEMEYYKLASFIDFIKEDQHPNFIHHSEWKHYLGKDGIYRYDGMFFDKVLLLPFLKSQNCFFYPIKIYDNGEAVGSILAVYKHDTLIGVVMGMRG